MNLKNRVKTILLGVAMITVLLVGTVGISLAGPEELGLVKGNTGPTKITHGQLKGIRENFELNKVTTGRAGDGQPGTIMTAFAGDLSCCNTMKDNECPVLKKENTISHERMKEIERIFELNKATTGWSSSNGL